MKQEAPANNVTAEYLEIDANNRVANPLSIKSKKYGRSNPASTFPAPCFSCSGRPGSVVSAGTPVAFDSLQDGGLLKSHNLIVTAWLLIWLASSLLKYWDYGEIYLGLSSYCNFCRYGMVVQLTVVREEPLIQMTGFCGCLTRERREAAICWIMTERL